MDQGVIQGNRLSHNVLKYIIDIPTNFIFKIMPKKYGWKLLKVLYLKSMAKFQKKTSGLYEVQTHIFFCFTTTNMMRYYRSLKAIVKLKVIFEIPIQALAF